jgi:F0F1-type ATP synthase assembly protein I
MEKRKRLGVALALYVVLGVLIWTTMSDVPVRIASGSVSIRALPLAVLAFFAVRTLLHWKADQIRAEHEK